METEEFWANVDDAREGAGGDLARQTELLTAALARRAPADIVSFDALFHTTRAHGYSWDLWAVGYLAAGGMSDDAFLDFRALLIAMGQAVWDRAVDDPDSLADVLDDDLGDGIDEAEGLGHAAAEAYRRSTGSEMPSLGDQPDDDGSDDDSADDDGLDDDEQNAAAAPSGLPWDENDPADLEKRCPRSWAKWGAGSDDKTSGHADDDTSAGADSADGTGPGDDGDDADDVRS